MVMVRGAFNMEGSGGEAFGGVAIALGASVPGCEVMFGPPNGIVAGTPFTGAMSAGWPAGLGVTPD